MLYDTFLWYNFFCVTNMLKMCSIKGRGLVMEVFQGNTFFFDWEVAAQAWLNGLIEGNSVLVAIVSFLTMFGEELVLIAVLGFLYWCYDKKFGKFVGTNILVGLVATPMLKNVFFRRRPYFDHESIKILKPVDSSADIYDISAQGYSFPSGHSTNSAILYGSLPMYKKGNKVLLTLAFVIPFLVGLSRVMLGAHYITDVLCGWALGALIMFLMSYLQTHVKNEDLLHLIIALVCLPGFFYCKTTDYFSGYGMMIGYFLACPFERKLVKFQETRSVIRTILRVVGGGAIYFGLNTLLKLPFSSDFLNDASMASYIVRALRYCIIVFVLIGVYPLIFDRIGKPKPKTVEKQE